MAGVHAARQSGKLISGHSEVPYDVCQEKSILSVLQYPAAIAPNLHEYLSLTFKIYVILLHDKFP